MGWLRTLVLGAALLSSAHLQAANDVLQIYPQVPGTTASTRFDVKVNGQPVFVEEYKNISFVHFAFAGQANIEVTYLPADVTAAKISPVDFAPTATISGKVMQFSLTNPQKLVVHGINEWASVFRSKDEPRLFVFADPLEDNPPSAQGPGIINVVDQGVDNTGATDVTSKLKTLIAGMTSGQTLYFPPGLYMTREMTFQNRPSNLAVYLAGGARVMAAPNAETSIFRLSHVSNFKLYGRGSLHANGFYYLTQLYHGIAPIKCDYADNVKVEDILLLDPSAFALNPVASQGWQIYNVKIIDYANTFPEMPSQQYSVGIDGMDPDDCKDVVIDNCFICSGDDSVSVKSSRSSKRFATMGNIQVRNNVHYQTKAGRTMGISTLTNSVVVENVTFENVQTVVTDVPFVLTPEHTGDTPTLSNIYLRNIVIEKCKERIIIGRYYNNGTTTVYPAYAVNNMQLEAVDIGTTAIDQFSIYGTSPGNINILMNGLYFNNTLVTSGYSALHTYGTATKNLSYANSLSPFVNVEAVDSNIDEYGNDGLFRFSRTGSTANALTVNFQLRGSAVNGVDYQTLPTSVTIPSGADHVDLPVQMLADGAAEGVETILLSLTNTHGSSYMIGPDFHAYMATDDDMIFRLDFNDDFLPSIYTNASMASGEATLLGSATLERGANTPAPSSNAGPVLYNAVNIPRPNNTDNSGLELLNTAASGTNNRWNNFFGNTFGNATVIMIYKPNYSGVVTASGASGRKYFVSHESSTTSKNMSLFISDNVHGPELRMGASPNMLSVSLPNFSWDSNSWYFIAASWSPGQKGRIYVRSLATGAIAQYAESTMNLTNSTPNGLVRFGVCSSVGGTLNGQNADGKIAYVALLKEYNTQASLDTYYADMKNGPDLSTPGTSVALKLDFRLGGDIASDYSVATSWARGISGATISGGALNIPRTSVVDAAGIDLWESQPGAGDHRWDDFFGNTFGEGTIGFLYKPNVSGIRKGTGAVNRMHFFTHRQGTLASTFAIFNNDTSGGPTLRLGGSSDPGFPGANNLVEAALGDFAWDAASWYYIGASWKVNGEARIYVRKQGQAVGSANYAASTGTVQDVSGATMNGLLRIGTRSNGDDSLGGENADGKIRNFRILGHQSDQANFNLLSTTALSTVP